MCVIGRVVVVWILGLWEWCCYRTVDPGTNTQKCKGALELGLRLFIRLGLHGSGPCRGVDVPFLPLCGVFGDGVSRIRMHIYRLEDERFVGGGSWDHGLLSAFLDEAAGSAGCRLKKPFGMV